MDLRYTFPEYDELYWGFAGTAERSETAGEWTHTIDSRSDELVVDAGTFAPSPDGDPAVCVETGRMVDFDDGAEKDYEEIWREEPIVPQKVVVLELKGRSPESRLAAEPCDAKGVVMRLGEWTQGILKYKGAVTSERWRRRKPDTPAADGAEEQVELDERVVKTGCGNLPCLALNTLLEESEGADLGVGYTLDDGQFVWEVVEESTW